MYSESLEDEFESTEENLRDQDDRYFDSYEDMMYDDLDEDEEREFEMLEEKEEQEFEERNRAIDARLAKDRKIHQINYAITQREMLEEQGYRDPVWSA